MAKPKTLALLSCLPVRDRLLRKETTALYQEDPMQTPFVTSVDHVAWSDKAKAQSEHAARETEYGLGPFKVHSVQFPYPDSGRQKVFIEVPRQGQPAENIEFDGSLLVQAHPPFECDCPLRRT